MASENEIIPFSVFEQTHAHMPQYAGIGAVLNLESRAVAQLQAVEIHIRELQRSHVYPRRKPVVEMFAKRRMLKGLVARLDYVRAPSEADEYLRSLSLPPETDGDV